MQEEGADGKQRQAHQQDPGNVRFNPVHGEQRTARRAGGRRA